MHDLLTLDEAAKQLRLSANTVYKLCRNGELPSRKVGRQWRIRQEDLHDWLRQHPQQPEQPPVVVPVARARPLGSSDPLTPTG